MFTVFQRSLYIAAVYVVASIVTDIVGVASVFKGDVDICPWIM